MCGEKGTVTAPRRCAMGSPPRVRGKGEFSSPYFSSSRITPACAGKSSVALFCSLSFQGSPPRVRGKVVVTLYTTGEKGITPACAGKSVAVGHWAPLARDHPRVCGEKPCVARALSAAVGSPPRVRGKAFALNVCINSPGITPACAGKSMAQSWRLIAKWDHPRVCGEKKTFPTEVFTLLGSPPRVRGKVPVRNMNLKVHRITPACAGKSQLES